MNSPHLSHPKIFNLSVVFCAVILTTATTMTDFAMFANAGLSRVTMVASCGTPSFGSAVNYPSGQAPEGIIEADFNKDGKSDLATANLNSGDVSIFLGTGTGTFNPATNLPIGTSPNSIAAGDFNGDTFIDLAVTLGGLQSSRDHAR